MPELLTTQELADRLHVRRDEVLEWVAMGYIPAIKAGRSYFYNLAAVVKALREQRAAELRGEVAAC